MKQVPVEVYSRVVGYYRPVNQWNKGKQEEFAQRSVINPKDLKNITQYEYTRTAKNIAC